MNKDIHPQWHPQATITCACGKTYSTGSTVEKIQTEICAACHPFYTGAQKIIDSARRVEKFTERAGKQVVLATARKGRRVKKETLKAKRVAKEVASAVAVE